MLIQREFECTLNHVITESRCLSDLGFKCFVNMVLPIVKVPSPILRMPAQNVSKTELKSSAMQALIDNMLATMPAAGGIGLAAPQVGSGVRIAVVAREDDPYVVINPSLVSGSGRVRESEEGCLSIPNVTGIVPRHAEIRVAALDRRGRRVNIRASGLLAFVFQHEIDHLNGILFVDRAIKLLTPVTDDQKKAFEAFRVEVNQESRIKNPAID